MSDNRRRSTRSPLKQEPLPQAGASSRRHAYDVAFGPALMWAVVAALFVGNAASEWLRYWLHTLPSPWFATALAVIAVVVAIPNIRRQGREVQRSAQGSIGERAVAECLEELRDKGYRIFHDLVLDGYNIDHVVIGPAGVFVVETKTYVKPANGDARIDFDGERIRISDHTVYRDPIKQVCANADTVRTILSRATGTTPHVQACVLFPGWMVNETRRRLNVWVLNPKRFLGYVNNEPRRLAPEQVMLLGEAMATHIRARLAATQ